MPIYEYRCRDCGRTFELLQRLGATCEGVACPACSSQRVERLLSGFASTSSAAPPGGGGCGPAPT